MASRSWQDAYVGATSPQVAVRVTDEERERLEELRRELRLTSKGQVIRAALDLLERVAVVGVALGIATDGDEWHKALDRVRAGAAAHQVNNAKSNTVASVPVDDLSEAASSTGTDAVDDRQLELPEMPARRPVA